MQVNVWTTNFRGNDLFLRLYPTRHLPKEPDEIQDEFVTDNQAFGPLQESGDYEAGLLNGSECQGR